MAWASSKKTGSVSIQAMTSSGKKLPETSVSNSA